MALRALFFSKNPDINAILTTVCQSAGVRVEVCDDIFTAIEKGTKQPFEILLVDWSSQPEAGFLVKRARESGPNKGFAAIAVVNRDPSAAEMREHGLEFLIHLPVSETEARDALANATLKMQSGGADGTAGAEAREESVTVAAPAAASLPESKTDQAAQADAKFAFEWSEDRPNEGETADIAIAPPRNYVLFAQQSLAVALALRDGGVSGGTIKAVSALFDGKPTPQLNHMRDLLKAKLFTREAVPGAYCITLAPKGQQFVDLHGARAADKLADKASEAKPAKKAKASKPRKPKAEKAEVTEAAPVAETGTEMQPTA